MDVGGLGWYGAPFDVRRGQLQGGDVVEDNDISDDDGNWEDDDDEDDNFPCCGRIRGCCFTSTTSFRLGPS